MTKNNSTDSFTRKLCGGYACQNKPRNVFASPISSARRNIGKPHAMSFYARIPLFPGAWLFVSQVGFNDMRARKRIRPHLHTMHEFFFISRGRLVARVCGRSFHLERGNMIILPAGVFHAFESDTPAELYYINYNARLDKRCGQTRNQPALPLVFPRVMIGQSAENISPLFENILTKTDPDARRLMRTRIAKLVKAIVKGFKNNIEMCDIRDGGGAVYDRRVAGGIKYMRRHAMKDLNLRVMCQSRLGLGLRHFSRLFKRATGYSPREFMFLERMKHADAMLKKKTPAKVVADKLGYEDVFSFYRAFHRATGHGVTTLR